MAWREGVYYAEVTEPGGEPVIYQSQDGETWTVSRRADILYRVKAQAGLGPAAGIAGVLAP